MLIGRKQRGSCFFAEALAISTASSTCLSTSSGCVFVVVGARGSAWRRRMSRSCVLFVLAIRITVVGSELQYCLLNMLSSRAPPMSRLSFADWSHPSPAFAESGLA